MGTLVPNASLYRCDLRSCLKLSRLFDPLSTDGKSFHRVGAPTLNDMQVNVLSLVWGIISKSGSEDE